MIVYVYVAYMYAHALTKPSKENGEVWVSPKQCSQWESWSKKEHETQANMFSPTTEACLHGPRHTRPTMSSMCGSSMDVGVDSNPSGAFFFFSNLKRQAEQRCSDDK